MHTERVQARASETVRKSNHRFSCHRLILLLLSVFGASLSLADPEPEKTLFDIEAQPASTALTLYARQARVQLGFSPDIVEGIVTNSVKGKYGNAQALELLLEGTGLEAELGDRTIIIRLASEGDLTRSAEDWASAAEDDVRLQLRQTAPRVRSYTPISPARNANTDEDETSSRTREGIEKIVVTGSRLRGAKAASPIVTIDREDIDRAGFATVAELVERLPQNFGAGASLEAMTHDVVARRAVGGDVGDFVGGTSVNLRGLGASSTLVLFNGRRMSPSGRSAGFTDISGIPLSAIERVEVLTDGASAIYGSDAIAGVINFITRDDYEGAETRLQYGMDTSGDTSKILLAQAFGAAWNDGNVLASYEYYHHEELANVDREFAASNDLRRFGGDDFRTLGGNPANVLAGGQLWAIPDDQDGTALTPADFPTDSNGFPAAPPNRHSFLAAGDMLPEIDRHSAFLSVSQNIGSTELFADLRLSTFKSRSRSSRSSEDLVVHGDDPATPEREGNPFFVDPTGSGLTSVTVQGYSVVDDIGPTVDTPEGDSYNVAFGARFAITDRWKAELVGNWANEEVRFFASNSLNRAALDVAINQTDPSLAFNPFGDGSHTNPSVLDALRDPKTEIFRTDNELRSVSMSVVGDIFDGSERFVQLAVGADLRQESLKTLDAGVSSGLATSIDDDREVLAVYGELLFPLFGRENSRPGIRQIELSLAARYEKYSDFGETTNPKVGLVWSPAESLVVRGTWGTAFRAPQLVDLNTSSGTNRWGYLPQPFVECCGIPFPVLIMQGANGDLRPEEATTWTAGIEWSPININGLRMNVTYFNVDFEDRIDTPFVSLLDGFLPRFSALLNTDPTQEQIEAIVNNINYINPAFGIPTPTEDILDGTASVGGIMDRRINNLSQSVVSGVDLQLSYSVDTRAGEFDIGLNGSFLFDFKRALLPTDPLIDEVDALGRPVDLRARANLTWSTQGWSVAAFVDYIDDYTDNVSDPARSIDSWTTAALTITYETDQRSGLFGDTRVSLAVQNLFDEKPPFVNNLGGVSYDPINASGVGRFVNLQLIKDW